MRTTAQERRRIGVTATLLALLYAGVVFWAPGRLADQALLKLTQDELGSVAAPTAEILRTVMSGSMVMLAAGVLFVWSCLGHRLRAGLTVIAAIGLSAAIAELLKLGVLSRPATIAGPDFALLPGTGSFPSGHVAVAAAVALAVVRLTLARWRAAVYVAVCPLIALVGVGVVVAGWHRLGDAVAGVLVALLTDQACALGLNRQRSTAPATPPHANRPAAARPPDRHAAV